MADEILTKALKERDELRSRLERLETFIELHRELSGSPSTAKGVEKSVTKLTRRRRGSGQPKQIAEWAEKLIRREGRPLTRGELADMMAAEGVEINSSDIPRYIGTVLWRLQNKFENVDDGYWLVGMQRKFV